MEQIIIKGQIVDYHLRRSLRAKRLKIMVKLGGAVELVVPANVSLTRAKEYLHHYADWILAKQKKFKHLPPTPWSEHGPAEYRRYKEKTRRLVAKRLEFFESFYGWGHQQLAIRNQSSRWGSCSTRGTLSFNYRLYFLPPALQDYIIVHELCHIKQMNHSPKFWQLVAKAMPDWSQHRRQLKHFPL